jgi:hypothetical protein
MIVPKYSAPIATKVAIDRRRLIRLPRCLQISAPFILFEASGGAEPWLGICEAGALAEVSKHGEGIQALALYRSQRPALPAMVCQMRGFAPGAALWLVTVGSWVEVWPEMRWLELFLRDLCCPPD